MFTAIRRGSSRHQVCRRSPSRLVLEIEVGERVAGGVADNEARVSLLDARWWEEVDVCERVPPRTA